MANNEESPRHCFAVPGRVTTLAGDWHVSLADRPALALAKLLPILGCGEEAAALAFDGLADRHRADGAAAAALDTIAREERVHDAMIRNLSAALPQITAEPRSLMAMRRFHVALGRGGPGFHLARIAALDSAVCSVLARLLRKGRPIAGDRAISLTLSRIHRDEGNHVRISRRLARHLGPARAIRDAAAVARERLAALLASAGEAFEDLGVDPGALDRDLRRLPDGLLTT